MTTLEGPTKWLIWALVVLVPVGFFAWDIADFLREPKTEREVLKENFLEDDIYATAIDELITDHGRDATLLDVHVDLRSAQFSVVTGSSRAVVEGFGSRGGGEANIGGGPVEDYERRIAKGELSEAMTLDNLVPDAPHHIVAGLRSHGVGIDDIVSLRLIHNTWSVLVTTGQDSDDTRRFTASPDGGIVRPQT